MSDSEFVAAQRIEAARQVYVRRTFGPLGSTTLPKEEGLTVYVLPHNKWASVVPPAEHWPFAFVDVFTGTSFQSPDSPIGLAQAQGASALNDADPAQDFRRLDDITSIQVRLTTATGSGGQCTITLQNDLEERELLDGRIQWERKFFKRGRFFDGARIRYMSETRGIGSGNIWFSGKLKQVSAGGIVELEGIRYVVDWDGEAPQEAATRLGPDRVFSEEMGESIFAPMQKIKIYAGNRFQPEVLENFGYRSTGGRAPRMRMPGREILLNEMLTFKGTAAYEYATNIFTGYVSSVSSSQQGSQWTMTLQARDVSCWLDYSMLNVNPSLNIFNRDMVTDAELQNWMIFTTRFEGMPAHEIIRSIFLGLREAYVTDLPALAYSSYGDNAPPMIGSDKKPLVLEAGSRVYIHGSYPSTNMGDLRDSMRSLVVSDWPDLVKLGKLNYTGPLGRPEMPSPDEKLRLADMYGIQSPKPAENRPKRYLVGTDLGIEGWVDSEYLSDPMPSYTGIGNFVIDDDPRETTHAILKTINEVREAFAQDKLIIDPAERGSVDEYVIQAYRRYFRENWPLIQSEYATRRSIVTEVCRHTNSECYADGGGRVWFHPIRAYTPVLDPVYVIHPEETISWEINVSDQEIVTWAHVSGEFDFHILPGDWLYNNAFTSEEMVRRFGVRAVHLSNPNIVSAEGAYAYAKAMLRRINANMITGRITIVLRPEIMLARNIFIPWLNLIGYVSAIDHTIHWGRSAITTLYLKYIRHPWDPWYPLEYQLEKEETDKISNASRDDPELALARNYSKAWAGKSFDRGVDKLQGHPVDRSVADAFSEVATRLLVPSIGETPIELAVVKTQNGNIVDIEVKAMKNVNTATSDNTKYQAALRTARINDIRSAFTKAGFTFKNMYDLNLNPELAQGGRGFLRLEYKKKLSTRLFGP